MKIRDVCCCLCDWLSASKYKADPIEIQPKAPPSTPVQTAKPMDMQSLSTLDYARHLSERDPSRSKNELSRSDLRE